MSKTKKYTFLKTKKSKNKYDENILLRFIFNENAKFPGIVVDINWFEFKDNTDNPRNNCELKYTVVKVPKKRNYIGLDDSAKEQFEQEIRDVFLDIFDNALKIAKAIKKTPKQIDEVKPA